MIVRAGYGRRKFLRLIKITLPGGASVRVDAKVDEWVLRRVLRVLRER